MPKICLLVLIGLPGAGKTTFSKELISKSNNCNIVHICYDDLINFELNFKNERKILIESIQTLIKSILYENIIPENFKQFVYCSGNFNNFILLFDDNNYYRGMRYEIFKLARLYEISFGQIYFDVTLETVLQQNKLRDRKIPDEIIEKMNTKIEIPNFINKWERNSFIIKNVKDINFSEVYDFVEKCFEKSETKVQVLDKQTMKQSEVHKIDILLRKQISLCLKNQENISAKELNNKRKCLLNDLKIGVIDVIDKVNYSDIINMLQ